MKIKPKQLYLKGWEVKKIIINKNELEILSAFRKNARESLTTASRKLRVPVSTLYDRLRKYQNSVITKHTALLDFEKLGYNIRVILSFKTSLKDKSLVQTFLENHHRINSIYKISNDSDFLIEAIFKNLIELNQFSEKLEEFSIKNKHEFYIVKDIKREAFLTTNEAIELIADE